MNDSFLEDLELIPKEDIIPKKASQQLDRHVTTRYATSSPLLHFSEQDERDNMRQQEHLVLTVPSTHDIKVTNTKGSSSRNSKKQPDQNVKKHSVSLKASEKTEKVTDSKGRHVEMKIKMSNSNQQSVSGENKIKPHETKTYPKTLENNDRKRSSGSHRDIIHSTNILSKENKRSSDSSNNFLDTSSKENSRPSDTSKEAGSHNLTKEKEKLTDKSRKSSFKIQDPVNLLTAIEELMSTYTKQESTKILRAMQELYINSQATLIKNLLDQTDDLVKEMHPSGESARMKALIEENEHLQQELMALRMRNENLQNKLEELEFLKQENATLKLKCNDIA